MNGDDEAVPLPLPPPLSKADFERLATFRSALRRYLRFSEETVRGQGVTSQQYQLMLAIKGFPERDWATIGELAEGLQLRHHSVVELVNRAQTQTLVARERDPTDGRVVRVSLTILGEELLGRLSALHRAELDRMSDTVDFPSWEQPGRGRSPGASSH